MPVDFGDEVIAGADLAKFRIVAIEPEMGDDALWHAVWVVEPVDAWPSPGTREGREESYFAAQSAVASEATAAPVRVKACSGGPSQVGRVILGAPVLPRDSRRKPTLLEPSPGKGIVPSSPEESGGSARRGVPLCATPRGAASHSKKETGA